MLVSVCEPTALGTMVPVTVGVTVISIGLTLVFVGCPWPGVMVGYSVGCTRDVHAVNAQSPTIQAINRLVRMTPHLLTAIS